MLMNPAVFDAEKEIQCQVAAILARRPQLEGLVKPFAALLIEKSRLAGDLKAQLDSTQFLGFGNRLAEGVPILSGLPFNFLKPALDRAFTALLPTVKAWFPAVVPELERIEIEQRNAALDLSHLAEEYLGGGPNGFRGAPLPSEVDRRGLGFIVHLTLSAVLQAMAPSLADRLMDIHWNRGYCPVCGSLPFISYLSKSQNASSEFLVGGGGRRYLHCAVCAHDWHVRRHLCAACEKEDSDQHMYFNVADATGERVDICPHCNHYLPCIDLREADVSPNLDTLAVGLAHLDMLAQEKGFDPMVRMPWNTFG